MNTIVTVDIKESDLPNLSIIESLNFKENVSIFTEREELFDKYPFTLYKERMISNHIITIQISLLDYFLYKSHNLIK